MIALGFDVGEKRIGVAKGDLEVKIATPLVALANDEVLWENIFKLIRENLAEILVVGLPRNSDGEETEQSKMSREFAKNLAGFLGENDLAKVKFYFQDESLTSVAAEKNLRNFKEFREKDLRDGKLDSEAAAIILQDFLEEFARKVGEMDPSAVFRNDNGDVARKINEKDFSPAAQDDRFGDFAKKKNKEER